MKFLNLRKRVQPVAMPCVPKGRRIYAIGDVHGRLDLLLDLIDRIRADHESRAVASAEIVMLGDLIDRGPQSAQILQFLLDHRPDFATFQFLKGNHEEAMLRSLEPMADPRENGWLDYGGQETLDSYGVPENVRAMGGWLLSDELRRFIPDSHLEFMRDFQDWIMIGDYVFVHAGIRPGIALARQKRADLYWIRHDFLNHESDHGFIVVHGHTITQEADIRLNRIGIDTGAYRTGVLTALALEGEERWMLATETIDGEMIPERLASRLPA